jgi:peptide/nickel transport system ATP-binding protein
VLNPNRDARAQLEAASVLAAGDVPSVMNPPTGCRYHTRCPFAQPICGEQRPPLEPADDPDHRVACHFWREIAAR